MTDRTRGVAPDYTKAKGAGKLLARAIIKLDLSQSKAADKVDVSAAFFNHLIHGRKVPGRTLAVKLRDVYNIPVEAWDQ